MSSITFHSEHGDASLHGPEGHHMSYLAVRAAIGHLDGHATRQALIPLVNPDHYLAKATGDDDEFQEKLETAWTSGVLFPASPLIWRGRPLRTFEISLNTAWAVGGDPLRLACRLAVEGHAWVDGPNRPWLADIIDRGLAAGILRPRMGWDEVTALLRARQDGPVVTSFSGADSFPDPFLGGWFPEHLPTDYRQLTDEQRTIWDARQDEWYESDDETMKWQIAMGALRTRQSPTLEMRPDTWEAFRFGRGLTVFDLLASDRAERLDRAFGLPPAGSAAPATVGAAGPAEVAESIEVAETIEVAEATGPMGQARRGLRLRPSTPAERIRADPDQGGTAGAAGDLEPAVAR